MSSNPKVFISAVTGDLASSRKLAADTLLSMECLPIEQDYFSPDHRSVGGMLAEKIKNCDAVVHLVGERFGCEINKEDKKYYRRKRPTSYTQLELQLGMKYQKKCYIFLCSSNYPFDTGGDPEPDELRRLQESYRNTGIKRFKCVRTSISTKQDLENKLLKVKLVQEEVARKGRRQKALATTFVISGLLMLAAIGGWFAFNHPASNETPMARLITIAGDEPGLLQLVEEVDRFHTIRAYQVFEEALRIEQNSGRQAMVGFLDTKLPRRNNPMKLTNIEGERLVGDFSRIEIESLFFKLKDDSELRFAIDDLSRESRKLVMDAAASEAQNRMDTPTPPVRMDLKPGLVFQLNLGGYQVGDSLEDLGKNLNLINDSGRNSLTGHSSKYPGELIVRNLQFFGDFQVTITGRIDSLNLQLHGKSGHHLFDFSAKSNQLTFDGGRVRFTASDPTTITLLGGKGVIEIHVDETLLGFVRQEFGRYTGLELVNLSSRDRIHSVQILQSPRQLGELFTSNPSTPPDVGITPGNTDQPEEKPIAIDALIPFQSWETLDGKTIEAAIRSVANGEVIFLMPDQQELPYRLVGLTSANRETIYQKIGIPNREVVIGTMGEYQGPMENAGYVDLNQVALDLNLSGVITQQIENKMVQLNHRLESIRKQIQEKKNLVAQGGSARDRIELNRVLNGQLQAEEIKTKQALAAFRAKLNTRFRDLTTPMINEGARARDFDVVLSGKLSQNYRGGARDLTSDVSYLAQTSGIDFVSSIKAIK